MDSAEVLDRFRQLRTTGDPKLRDELITAHLPLARYFAARYASRAAAREDLDQVAVLGLIEALDRFDPERDVQFSTFAGRTIDGRLKRHFRDHTWAMRTPRRLKELHGQLRRATEELTHQNGRPPTTAELAARLGAEVEEIIEALDAGQGYRADSLDRPFGADDGVTLGEATGQADASYEGVERELLVRDILAGLPPRERAILELRFFGELTQSEIAERLGISQMHVSRLLRRTVEQLRIRIHTG
ncbi:MAG: SigB/SigF/SigG family RNA polymerase sigma factor [Acidimicrobiales bacterium]